MSARTFWFGSMTKTARTVAVSEAPGWMSPYFCATFVSRSATTGKSILTPKCPSMFLIQAMCAGTESTERPMSCAPRLRNSSARRANSTNSVVQTGVKSAGCEKSTTHLPLKSESFNCPCVDLASKSGAGSLMRGKVLEVSCVAAVLITRLLFRVEVYRLTVPFVSTGGARRGVPSKNYGLRFSTCRKLTQIWQHFNCRRTAGKCRGKMKHGAHPCPPPDLYDIVHASLPFAYQPNANAVPSWLSSPKSAKYSGENCIPTPKHRATHVAVNTGDCQIASTSVRVIAKRHATCGRSAGMS